MSIFIILLCMKLRTLAVNLTKRENKNTDNLVVANFSDHPLFITSMVTTRVHILFAYCKNYTDIGLLYSNNTLLSVARNLLNASFHARQQIWQTYTVKNNPNCSRYT